MGSRDLTIHRGIDPSLSDISSAASSKRASIESSLSFVMLKFRLNIRMLHGTISTQKVAKAFRRVSVIRAIEYNETSARVGYEFICMVHKENVKSSLQIV